MLPFSRFEAKTILKLSGPIMVAQLTQTMMYVIDTVMAGKVSVTDMAAVAIGSAIWLPVLITFQGLLLALTPIVAQHFGAGRHERILPATYQASLLALLLALLIFLLMQAISIPVGLMQMDEALKIKALDYLGYVTYGIFPAAGYMVLRNLYEGIGYTKAAMWISFVGILVNIPANYVFIYGKFGMPALGGAGCGLATSLVFLAMFATLLVYAWRGKRTAFVRQPLPDYQPDWTQIRQLLALGTPVAFAFFFEVTLFTCIPLMIAHLGPTVVASHQIANNFCSMVFMLPLSIGLAATIRVGHLMGANDVRELKKAVATAIQIGLLLAVGIALMTLLLRHWVAAQYSTDPAVLELAAAILVLACFYQLSDAVQVICSCTLRGLKYTKPIFYITFIAYWPIGFGLGCVLGLTDYLGPAMGAQGFWIGIIIGLTVAAIALARLLVWHLKRIENGSWQAPDSHQAALH
jgi:MATE family multidrug resistance protein